MELESKLGRVTLRLAKTETALEHARAQVAWFHRQLFGQKSEHVDPVVLEQAWKRYRDEQEAKAREVVAVAAVPESSHSVQMLLMLGGVQARAPETAEAALAAAGITPSTFAPPDSDPAKKRRDNHGRRKLPGALRVEEVELTLENSGDSGVRRVDSEVSYRIGIRPAEVFAIAIERHVYDVHEASGETRREAAELPAEMIDGGLLAPSALAHVVAKKWDKHMPYTRLSSYFAQHDVDLPVSTMSGVTIRASRRAAMLVTAMTLCAQEEAEFLGIDATGALVQSKGRCVHGHTWLRYAEGIGVFVSFTPKHDTNAANDQLFGWRCPVVADGAAVFDDFERRGGKRAGCLAHARRKFFYAAPTDPRALIGLKWINKLFEHERAWVDEEPAVRLAARQQHSEPVFDELIRFARSVGDGASIGRHSLLSKAARYVLRQQKRLRGFLTDGRIPIHNNNTELQARHFAVGRNNWVFYGSETGAVAGSIWLTLVLSARMHGLAVEPYLRDLFRVMPSWPTHRLLELAPHAWMSTRARLDPAQLTVEYGPLTIPPPIEPTSSR